MSSLSCPHSGLRIVRTITINQGDEIGWSVHHRLINESEHAINCGIWSVMMIKSAALYCYECNGAADFECMLGGVAAFVETCKGVNFIHCNAKDEFKMGDQPVQPKVHAVLAAQGEYLLLSSEVSELTEAENYLPAHALEIYQSAHYPYTELEWHSPSALLAPAQAIELQIDYSLTSLLKDEARTLTAAVSRHLKES